MTEGREPTRCPPAPRRRSLTAASGEIHLADVWLFEDPRIDLLMRAMSRSRKIPQHMWAADEEVRPRTFWRLVTLVVREDVADAVGECFVVGHGRGRWRLSRGSAILRSRLHRP